MLIEKIIPVLEEIAPLSYAAEWDNVGLLAGSGRWEVDSILLTIDLTKAVLAEAKEMKKVVKRGGGNRAVGGPMIVSYHPPIFEAVKSITDKTSCGRVLVEAMSENIGLYSPHTALDAAPGGVNDWLAECLGEGDCRALAAYGNLPESEQCKIVVFCPVEPPGTVERIRNGLVVRRRA